MSKLLYTLSVNGGTKLYFLYFGTWIIVHRSLLVPYRTCKIVRLPHTAVQNRFFGTFEQTVQYRTKIVQDKTNRK